MTESAVESPVLPALGEGEQHTLDKPHETPFGPFSTRIDYQTGCKAEEVLQAGGVLSFSSAERFVPRFDTGATSTGAAPDRPLEQTTTEVLIGKTPDGFVMPLESEQNAGDPGEYLLHQKTTRVHSEGENVVERFTYLDADDMRGVVLQTKRLPIFNINKTRGRNIRVQGKVASVASYHN